ncbi:hypothetical protein HNY73_004062 [Argiope bruennichi]|uniref:Uncharacterized protein n=1 Tax=Argiope bruennichi TaxID=94029 RepID=A0A8T0FN31_ARGBR|nr:hypothetical protein HNY73_004062 [Argiope bruennichi]
MDQRTSNSNPRFVCLYFHCQPGSDQRMMAQVKEDITIWELHMMAKYISTDMTNDRQFIKTPSIELFYKGNKLVEYQKTVKDFGINSSNATRENPAIVDLIFRLKGMLK